MEGKHPERPWSSPCAPWRGNSGDRVRGQEPTGVEWWMVGSAGTSALPHGGEPVITLATPVAYIERTFPPLGPGHPGSWDRTERQRSLQPQVWFAVGASLQNPLE